MTLNQLNSDAIWNNYDFKGQDFVVELKMRKFLKQKRNVL